MTAEAVLERAQSVGVHLYLFSISLRAAGNQQALSDLLPDLCQHRAELVHLLSKKTKDQIQKGSSVSTLAGGAANDFQAPEISRISSVSKVAGGGNTLPAPAQSVASVATVASSHGATATPKPLPKFHIAQPWNALDRDFQAHYWQCPACKAAGRIRGPLCPQGQPLSAAVDQAFAAA